MHCERRKILQTTFRYYDLYARYSITFIYKNYYFNLNDFVKQFLITISKQSKQVSCA